MNLLVLTHRVPHPPNRGDRIRSYHLLKYLSEYAHISLATVADEPVSPESRQTLEQLCKRVAIESNTGRMRWFRAGLSLATNRTATAGAFYSRSLKQTVRQWAQAQQFDGVLVYCSSMFQYTEITELQQVPLLVDLVDVDSQKWFDYANLLHGPRRWLYKLEGRRLRQLEQRLTAQARSVALVSEQEADLFRKVCPNNKTIAISNGVDTEYFANPGPTEERAQTCIFVGVLDYQANIDGLQWFVENVWQAVRTRFENATFSIVGRNPGKAVQRLATAPGVRLVGAVEDIRPYYWQSQVSVVPLRIARGIQNKVLEAMAMSKPVVATPAALEGIACTSGKNVFAAPDADTWIETLCDLFSQPEKGRALGSQAREFVVGQHSWKACYQPWHNLLNQISRQQRQTESDSSATSSATADPGVTAHSEVPA